MLRHTVGRNDHRDKVAFEICDALAKRKKIKFEDRSAVCVFRLHVALDRERGA